jgi:plastocyanin
MRAMPTASADPATASLTSLTGRRLRSVRLQRGAALLGVGLLTLAAAGCSHSSTNAAKATTVAAPAGPPLVQVAIPKADRFTPAVTAVVHGGQIVFHNGDTDAHTVTSVPGDPAAFNLQLPPGATVKLALNASGLYRYYCTRHAFYDPQTGQIAANRQADHPNEPMAGVIAVT